MPKEGGDSDKEIAQNFDKSNIVVESLIIGARLQAKLTGKTAREICYLNRKQ